jgi:hypothetical protein
LRRKSAAQLPEGAGHLYKYRIQMGTARSPLGASSYGSAACGMLSDMGNKDRRSREAKKPKKTTPKLPPPRRDSGQTTRVISVTNPEKPPTGSE